MKYELSLFESIISGTLSPFKLNPTDHHNCLKHLCEKQDTHTIYTIVQLKASKTKYTVITKKELSSFHPFFDSEIQPNLSLFRPQVQKVPNEIQRALKINMATVKGIASVTNNNITTLYITTENQTSDLSPVEATFYFYNDLLKTEVHRLKQAIKDEVFGITNADQLEQFIQKKQRALIALSLKVMAMLEHQGYHDVYNISAGFTELDILALVYIRLEQLLNFIERNYPQHLDENMQIPQRSALIESNNSLYKLEHVWSVLSAANLEPNLLNLLLEPLVKLTPENNEIPVTYREINYSLCYLDAFYDLLKRIDASQTDLSTQVINIVYQVNLNSMAMFSHETDSIKSALSQLTGIEAQLNHLHLSLKLANQRLCRTDIAFDTNLPPIRAQLVTWIDEEINYLNKRNLLSVQPNPSSSPDQNIKIKTTLSVAQLSLFFKIQTEVGIIPNKNVGDLFSYLVANYSTNNTAEISYDSLRNKFYNPEQSSVDMVRTKLIEMLNKINNIDLDK